MAARRAVGSGAMMAGCWAANSDVLRAAMTAEWMVVHLADLSAQPRADWRVECSAASSAVQWGET